MYGYGFSNETGSAAAFKQPDGRFVDSHLPEACLSY